MHCDYQLMEKYYAPLVEVGRRVFRRYFQFSNEDLIDLSHRIVLEFFDSFSLNSTFNPKKGNLESYFAAYCRLRILSLRREFWKDGAILSYESWMSGECAEFESKYDFANWLVSLFSLLKGKSWVCECKSIPYDTLCKAIAVQVIKGDTWGGDVNRTKIALRLGVKREDVSKAIEGMREVLHGFSEQGLI